jgi:hypothetical protein
MTGGDARADLRHVLWIGGPPDSGKTTIADMLAERYGLQVYHFDRHEPDHFARLRADRHPAMLAVSPEAMDLERRWVSRPPDMMARQTIGAWRERFGMVIEDLLALPAQPPIVAEGAGLFPECVHPFIDDPARAVWLVPTEGFKHRLYAARGKADSFAGTSNPERANRNLVERDLLLGEHVARRARELGLTVLEVDGARTVGEMAEFVAAHFGAWMPGYVPDASDHGRVGGPRG